MCSIERKTCEVSKDIEDMGFNNKNEFQIPEISLEKYKSLVKDLIGANVINQKTYNSTLIQLRRKYHINPSKSQMLLVYNKYLSDILTIDPPLSKLMIKKAMRSASGINQITSTMAPEWTEETIDQFGNPVRTIKKFSCGFDCDFCPDERDENGKQTQPRSYLSREPAMLRASRVKFDAKEQFNTRAKTYLANGHKVDKVEFIALGGTFDCYDRKYSERFIAETYHAANVLYTDEVRNTKTLEEEIEINETSKCSIIGITLETRPDMINKKALLEYRRYNATRIQIGIQHLDDEILKINNRKCFIKDTKKAIRMLKGVGLKVVGHYMPDLPGSSPEQDEEMFMQAVSDGDIQLDDWKIYPTAVTPYTKIKEKYDAGEYIPYAENNINLLINLLVKIKPFVPRWVRIERLIRDIPSTYIEAGYDRPDLRNVIHDKMRAEGKKCECLRCMEVKNRVEYIPHAKPTVITYQDSHGKEYFISYQSCDCKICWSWIFFSIWACIYKFFTGTNLYWQGCKNYVANIGFCRLRHDVNPGLDIFPELKGCGLVRELHVYGNKVQVHNKTQKRSAQHSGFGRKMMNIAEDISQQNGYNKVAVIAGTGVRKYYERKCGYTKIKTYMIKSLINEIDMKWMFIRIITYILFKVMIDF
ncbi:Radical_SAM C-terminal domain [seawater metagenome]|uniref:tRNA carboxymethyluridine synthase n=1 Tax=seawater metagenome TaxID=1561972 RepID=A0A5E8CHS0_9ZZZZ